jgi:hypothetical protein
MQLHHQPAPPPPTPRGPSRAVWTTAIVTALLAAATAAVFATRGEDPPAASPPPAPSSAPSTAAATTTTIDPRTEVVARLKEILKVRDKAFHERNARLLSAVYTVDCPCLEGDTNAIKELLGRNYHLIGGATSIRVRRVERVNSRLWLVVADFNSAPLRIETESGDLVRQEPAGSDLFQFTLAKPVDTTQWLLGRASAYKDG